MSIISEALRKASSQRLPTDPSGTEPHLVTRKSGQNRLAFFTILGILVTLVALLTVYLLVNYLQDYRKAQPLKTPQQVSSPRPHESSPIGNAQFAIELQSSPSKPMTPLPSNLEGSLMISGIVSGYDGYHAVINGSIVEEGDKLRGMRVEKIYKDRIVLSQDGKEFVLTKQF